MEQTREPARRLTRWLDRHEVERTGRATPARALLTVVLVYLIGFGMPVYVAIWYDAHARTLRPAHAGHWSLPLLLELGLNLAGVLVAVPLLMREAPGWARPRLPGSRWLSNLKSFVLTWLAVFAGGIAMRLLAWLPHPPQHAAWDGVPGLLAGLLAGPTEEIVVLVVPLVFLRAARWPWWAVVPAMLVLRLAYHVYYGFPVLGFAVWATAMIVIYLRTHAVIGMILAHSTWDIGVMVGTRWAPLSVVMLLASFVVVIASLAWGIVSLSLWLLDRADRRRPPAPPLPVGWYQNGSGHWWWWDGRHWLPPAQPPAIAPITTNGS